MKIKKKLKDLTKKEYSNWREKNCDVTKKCNSCIFKMVGCGDLYKNCWIFNKDLFSDKFLNQEIDVEVPDPKVLTKDEKEYLSFIIESYRDRVESVTKFSYKGIINSSLGGNIRIIIRNRDGDKADDVAFLPFIKGKYKKMEDKRGYSLTELGL